MKEVMLLVLYGDGVTMVDYGFLCLGVREGVAEGLMLIVLVLCCVFERLAKLDIVIGEFYR